MCPVKLGYHLLTISAVILKGKALKNPVNVHLDYRTDLWSYRRKTKDGVILEPLGDRIHRKVSTRMCHPERHTP